MKTRRLGADGPEISVVGYGAWEAGGADWGPNASDDVVVESMQVVFDVGINWIDTAEVYGQGHSEELVARAIAGRRDEVLIFTKVAPDDEGSGIRPEEIRTAIRGSLARLQTDHVDLYQVHWRDDRVPVEDTWGAMAEEDDRADLLSWLAEQGIGYLAYGPLGFGLLTDAIGPDTMFHPDDWRGQQRAGSKKEGIGPFSPENFERNLERVEPLRSIAEPLGIPVSTLALAWVVHQEGVTAAIAGSRNAAHVASNAGAADVTLDAPTLEEIDSIFGPE